MKAKSVSPQGSGFFTFMIVILLGLLPSLQAGGPKELSPTLYKPKESDAQLSKLLSGTWSNQQKGFIGTVTYRENGTWECSLKPEEFLVKLVTNTATFEGTWKIEGGLLYTIFTRSDLKSIVLNSPYRDEFLQLDNKILQTRNQKRMITTFLRK